MRRIPSCQWSATLPPISRRSIVLVKGARRKLVALSFVVIRLSLCEATPIKDTLPGLLPESLIAGTPILILAAIGGLLTVFLASHRHRTERAPGAAPEVSTT